MVIKNKSFDIVSGPAMLGTDIIRGKAPRFILRAAGTAPAVKFMSVNDVQIHEATFEEGSNRLSLIGIAKVGSDTEYRKFCGDYDTETHKGRLTFFY